MSQNSSDSSNTLKLEIESTGTTEKAGVAKEVFMATVLQDENLAHIYRQIDQDFVFNVVVLGDPKVGKTSLI